MIVELAALLLNCVVLALWPFKLVWWSIGTDRSYGLLSKSQSELSAAFETLPSPLHHELSGLHSGRIFGFHGLNAVPAIAKILLYNIINMVSPWLGKNFEDGGGANAWKFLSAISCHFGWYEFDTMESGSDDPLQLNYNTRRNPAFMRAIRGEIKLLQPGIYLARMTYVTKKSAITLLYFVLEAPSVDGELAMATEDTDPHPGRFRERDEAAQGHPTPSFSTIIVGSGFGGASVASTLVEGGMEDVLVLERGPWRKTSQNMAIPTHALAPLPQGWHFFSYLIHRVSNRFLPIRINRYGLFDISLGSDQIVVASNSVGGGSIVYSAMNTKPDDPGYWHKALSRPFADKFDEHYDWIMAKLGSRVSTFEDELPNWLPKVFERSQDFVASLEKQVPVSIKHDRDCKDNSFLGSNNGSKKTLDQALLVPAMEKGLSVSALTECIRVKKHIDGKFSVHVRHHTGLGYDQVYTADNVVLASGTMNTVRLLFCSRQDLGNPAIPALGTGWSSNGDVVALWKLDDTCNDLSLGPPSHGRFTLKDGGEQSSGHIFRLGFNGFSQVPLPRFLKNFFRRNALLLGMDADRCQGMLRPSSHPSHLDVQYKSTQEDAIPRIRSLFKRIARISGKGVWHLPFANQAFTVHPLGGARVADNQEYGVVNEFGEVFGVKGLYVADAAALPAATGTPPSMTVAAWGRHVGLQMVRRHIKVDPMIRNDVTRVSASEVTFSSSELH